MKHFDCEPMRWFVRRYSVKFIFLLSSAALALAVASTSAFAHATFANKDAKAEGYIAAALQVPHGCDGRATNDVIVKLPEGFIAAKPQPKAGWKLEVIKGKYQKSYDNHGTILIEGPVEIRWTGGDLPDAFYDTFVIYGKVSGVAPGTKLPFVVTQVCGADAKVAWDEIPATGVDAHSLKHPAPTLTIVAAGEDPHAGMMMAGMATGDHGHDHTAMMEAAKPPAESGSAHIGALKLSAGFLKAMLPGQPVGGGYVTIENTGAVDDKLVSVSSPDAAKVELHEMSMTNNVMKMRRVDGGLAVAAGGRLEMQPGGYHLMFMGVKKPFAAGEKVPVTLTFEKAGKVEMLLPVMAGVRK
jgi:periplasmic copper chaperone A